MQKEKTAILGISIGTRKVGISVLSNGELIDWRVSVFKGTWSRTKLSRIVRYIEHFADKYQVQSIALKVPSLIESSPGLQPLMQKLKLKCAEKNRTVLQYSLSDLKQFCFGEESGNKRDVMEYISSKFPELSEERKKEALNRNSYYIPMFEAIIASLLAANTNTV